MTKVIKIDITYKLYQISKPSFKMAGSLINYCISLDNVDGFKKLVEPGDYHKYCAYAFDRNAEKIIAELSVVCPEICAEKIEEKRIEKLQSDFENIVESGTCEQLENFFEDLSQSDISHLHLVGALEELIEDQLEFCDTSFDGAKSECPYYGCKESEDSKYYYNCEQFASPIPPNNIHRAAFGMHVPKKLVYLLSVVPKKVISRAIYHSLVIYVDNDERPEEYYSSNKYEAREQKQTGWRYLLSIAKEYSVNLSEEQNCIMSCENTTLFNYVLEQAVETGRCQQAWDLLGIGFDINKKDSKGDVPLDILKKHEVVKLYLSATPQTNVDWRL